MKERFRNRKIVVTGGAMGIGAATARTLVEEGAFVYIVDKIQDAAEELVASLDGRAQFLYADLSDQQSIRELGSTMLTMTDSLHGLVNNGGIVLPSSIAESNDDDWDPQLAINLRAPLLCTQVLLPLLKRGPGHIVNISSEAAFRPRAGNIVYDATKAAVCSLTRSMAVEFAASGIRANTVAPGWTVTEMHTGRGDDSSERRRQLESLTIDSNILGRLGRPHEIAAAVVFLLSDDASYITASTIHADGGRVAN